MIKKKILVCPLNWGLGHATRCVPIIQLLIQRGHEVHLASDGIALELLRKEFPGLPAIQLPGYDIHYKGKNLLRTVAAQLPRILKTVILEHRFVQAYVKQNSMDVILSDNRFGCYSGDCVNIFITHQLRILTPLRLMSAVAGMANRFLIRHFDRIWVPDFPPPQNLSGYMSSSGSLHPVYIGPLSRLQKLSKPIIRDFIVILSGPEPARSDFEQIIISQASLTPYRYMLVRGVEDQTPLPDYSGSGISWVNNMTTEELSYAIAESRRVISRTGYTTVMDLMALGASGILVPTPGQPEQEYLAQRLKQQDRFILSSQEKFDLRFLTGQSLDDDRTFEPISHNLTEKAVIESGL